MKSDKTILLLRLLATLGLIGFFCLLALTWALHFHTPTVDQTQQECPLCLIRTPHKVFVVPSATAPLLLKVGVVVVVFTRKPLSLPLWDKSPSRSPPLLA